MMIFCGYSDVDGGWIGINTLNVFFIQVVKQWLFSANKYIMMTSKNSYLFKMYFSGQISRLTGTVLHEQSYH